jgi:cell wall-associated NlpC family hydrolase
MRNVLATAVGLRGSRYQLGGTTPQGGFDCSGFVRYVFAQYRLEVPRTVAEQYRAGHEVARTHIGPGDLLFFSTTGPGATHVGIVVDPVAQTFVHAPGTGAVVRIERFDTAYWRSRMLAARRLPVPVGPVEEARSGR